MGVENMLVVGVEKFKVRFFVVVLLSIWFIKFRFICRRLCRLNVIDNNEFVIFDNVFFFFKSVENCYKNGMIFEECIFSFFEGLYIIIVNDFIIFSLCFKNNEVRFVFIFFIFSRKSIVCFEGILSR